MIDQQRENKEGVWSVIIRQRQAFFDWVWAVPEPEESWSRKLRPAFFRVLFIVFQEFKRDRVLLRASALTFVVLLSIVPLLALGTSVLKGLGADGLVRDAAYRYVDHLEISPQKNDSGGKVSELALEVEKQPETIGNEKDYSADQPEGGVEGGSLAGHLRRAVDLIFDYVDQTKFAKLGAFGIIGLFITVISMFGSIEEAMNAIWRTPRTRPLSRKIVDYLALMVLFPLTIIFALATEAFLQNQKLFTWFQDFLPLAWLAPLLLNMLPMVLVVLVFTFLFRFLPNTPVKIFPAMVGGIIGGFSWLSIQALYVEAQIGVAKYNAIYGSFATLPLFLLWIYVGWVVFLLGAETSFAVQEWRGYMRKEMHLLPSLRLAIAFTILDMAVKDFHTRAVTSFQSLTDRIRQPVGFIRIVLEDLIKGGLLLRVEGKQESVVPASSEEDIKPAEVVDLILGQEVSDLSASFLAETALTAAKKSLSGKTISTPCETQSSL